MRLALAATTALSERDAQIAEQRATINLLTERLNAIETLLAVRAAATQ